LSCTGGTTQAVSSGQASFSCFTDTAGEFRIKATDSASLSPADSSYVDVNAGPASQLAFSTEPQNASTNVAFPVSVSVEDSFGNLVTSDSTDEVSLAITAGTGSAGAGLSCTPNGATAVSFGAASFQCSIDTSGLAYTLTAASPNGTLTSATSSAFAIGQESASIAVSPVPAVIVNGSATFAVTAAVTDAAGKPVSGDQIKLGGPFSAGAGSVGPSDPAPTDGSGRVSFSVGCFVPYCSQGQPISMPVTDTTTRTLLGDPSESFASLAFPTEGSVAQAQTLSLTGFAPNSPVAVGFAASPSSKPVAASLSGTCTTDASGSLKSGTCSFTVPSLSGVSLPADVTASITLGAGAGAQSLQVSYFLEQTPAIQLSPSTGQAGTVITVDGAGFGAFGTRSVTLIPAGATAPSVTVNCQIDGEGNIINDTTASCQLTVPAGTAEGPATVAVTGSPTATASFDVTVPCASDPTQAGCSLSGISIDTAPLHDGKDLYVGATVTLPIKADYSDGSSALLPVPAGGPSPQVSFTPATPAGAITDNGLDSTNNGIGLTATALTSSPATVGVTYDGFSANATVSATNKPCGTSCILVNGALLTVQAEASGSTPAPGAVVTITQPPKQIVSGPCGPGSYTNIGCTAVSTLSGATQLSNSTCITGQNGPDTSDPGKCQVTDAVDGPDIIALTPPANDIVTGVSWSAGSCGSISPAPPTPECLINPLDFNPETVTFTLEPRPQPQPQLDVSVSGSGTVSGSGINCPGVCAQSYPPGTVVLLSATAAPGSTFAGWLGACHGTGTCSLTVNANQSVSAIFNETSLPCSELEFGLVDARTSGSCLATPTDINPKPEVTKLAHYLHSNVPVECRRLGSPFGCGKFGYVLSRTFFSTGPVRINGLTYTPAAGSAILLDPVDDLIVSHRATISLPIGGVSIPLLTGPVLQTVQYPFKGYGPPRVAGFPVGNFQLPQGLGLPHTGLTLSGGLSVTLDRLGNPLSTSATEFKTFIQGSVTLPGLTAAETPQPVGKGFSLSVNGAFAPANGSIQITADNANGTQINNASISVPVAWLGPIELEQLQLEFSGTNQNPAPSGWQCGSAAQADEACGSIYRVIVPGLGSYGSGPGAGASIDLLDGQVRAVTLNLLPNVDLIPGVLSLSGVGGGIAFNPFYLTLNGSVKVFHLLALTTSSLMAFGSPGQPFTLDKNEVAPFGSSYALASLVGMSFPEPIVAFGTGASVSLPDPLGSIPVADLWGVLGLPPLSGPYTPYLQAGASVDTAFPFGFVATVEGQFSTSAFLLQAQGQFEFQVPGLFKITTSQGTGVLSSNGMAVCIGPSASGFGASWDGHHNPAIWLHGCNLTKFEPQLFPSESRAGVGLRFRIPRGSRGEEVRLDSAGGAPSVILTAPNGRRLIVDQASGLRRAGRLVGGRAPTLDQTVLAVTHPLPGTYTITPLPGSVAITGLETAAMLPPLHVTGRVSGSGENRVLHYSIVPRPGQRVTLLERGLLVNRALKTIVGGGSGTLRFTPAPGPGGRRQIIAQTTLNGLPSPSVTIARFTAPSPPRLVIKRIVARRKGTRLLVSWSATAGADRYAVLVVLGNGHDRQLTVPSTHRSVSFSRIPRTVTVMLLVRGETAFGESGPARGVRLRPAA